MFYKKQLVLASFQLRQEFSCQVAVSLLNRLHQRLHLYGPQPLIRFPRQTVVNLGTEFPYLFGPELTTWFYHVQPEERIQKEQHKTPKAIFSQELSVQVQEDKKNSNFLLSFVSQEISIYSFPPFSPKIFFLHNGDPAFQSVNCKPVSQQSTRMTLSTKMLGQNLTTSLRFYIEKWHLRWPIPTQVF